MTKRILIDAAHQEETRAAFLVDSRLEEYVSESAERKILKGNIYLGRVTRVEPSLQAAFVDYGGSRHGFISFHDIHPDYFRIPVSDREDEAEDEDSYKDDFDNADSASDSVSDVGGGDSHEDARPPSRYSKRRIAPHRHYKIQEVLTSEKPLLVQVIKEERGTKGAALSTYLSLAGRCCVLIPNSTRSGGISRRIEDTAERKRFRDIITSLNVPSSMSVIIRTAVRGRTKQEISRDYEYLLSLWSGIRERTLGATAPSLIHEDGDLIMRTLRDMHTSDVDEIVVSGKSAWESARTVMSRMVASHARRIKLHKSGGKSLFQEYGVEGQIAAIYRPKVLLRSGGHIVLQQTEALVSIDVNSGKSTRERHIEGTALRTNLEAGEEISRQLRLRDLAGLIVIDFIDMDGNRARHDVEHRMRELLSLDRARIQMGRISHFSLLELSRQRLHPTVVERASLPCESCGGTGYVPVRNMVLLGFLRSLEEQAGKLGKNEGLELRTIPELGLAFLNEKRQALLSVEERYGVRIDVAFDSSLRFGESKILRLPSSPLGSRLSSSLETDDENLSDTEDDFSARPSSARGGARSNSRSQASRQSSSSARSKSSSSRGSATTRRRAPSRRFASDERDSHNDAHDDRQHYDTQDASFSSAQPDDTPSPPYGKEGSGDGEASLDRSAMADNTPPKRTRRVTGIEGGRAERDTQRSSSRQGQGKDSGRGGQGAQPDDSDPRDFLGTSKTL